MNYYERHIGDYLKDTAHLSLLEHGIYTRLLDVYYTRETPLPDDQVARLIGARSKEEKEALSAVLGEFFQKIENAWMQSRCESEICRYQDKQRKAKASADARWAHTERNANASADAMRTHSEGNAPSNQTPDTSNQLKITGTDVPVRAEGSAPAKKSKVEIPDCPHQKILELWAEVLPTMPQHTEWNEYRQAHLRSRWREKAVEKGWKSADEGIAFFRKLFAYVGKSRFLTGQTKLSDPNRKPFLIELEWLLSPGNWAKTIEGKYHTED